MLGLSFDEVLVTFIALIIVISFSYLQPQFIIAKRNLLERTIFFLEIIYGSFVVFSTLCLIRLTSLLPQFLNNKNPIFDPNKNQSFFHTPQSISNMKIYALFSEYFLISFPTACILAFILSRVIFNFIEGNAIVMRAVARGKTVWTNTLVCWAAIFTVISTISLLISTSS